MNPLTPEDIALIKDAAKALGFHPGFYTDYGPNTLVAYLQDYFLGHELEQRKWALYNTLSLANLRVTGVIENDTDKISVFKP